MLNFLRHFQPYLITVLIINYSSVAQDKASNDLIIDYEEAASYLFGLTSTGESVEVTSESIFNKDVGSFKLQEGILYLCSRYKGISYVWYLLARENFLLNHEVKSRESNCNVFMTLRVSI